MAMNWNVSELISRMSDVSQDTKPLAGAWMEADATSIGFLHLTRLVRRLFAASRQQAEEVWTAYSPETEAKALESELRYRSRVSLGFPASDVQSLKLERNEEQRPLSAEMLCNFMGIAGHEGPLPDHYTELLFERARKRDYSLHEFLDIFNHRLITLFYAAWEKYHFLIPYERAGKDPVFEMLLATMGAGQEQTRRSLPTPMEFGAYYSTLLTRTPVSAEAAVVILSQYFSDIPISLQQFTGRWVVLDDESRCILGNADSGNALGGFCPLGEQVWDVTGQVTLTLRLNPIQRQQFSQGGEKRAPLVALFRYLTGSTLDVDLKIVTGITPWKLGEETPLSGSLGQSVWLGTSEEGTELDQAFDDLLFERAFENSDGAF